jgi:hypothetical protein
VDISFDVDQTIVDNDTRPRPGLHDLFTRLCADGHTIYLWSSLEPRWEVVEALGLAAYIAGCYDKPRYRHAEMLAPLGIPVRPDFCVDDQDHAVAIFGGVIVSRYERPDPADRELERVHAAVGRSFRTDRCVRFSANAGR